MPRPMPETAKTSILQKMAAPKSGAAIPVAGQLRRALETAAETRLGLSVEVRGVHQSLRPLEEVRGLLADRGFLALLEGRPSGGFGIDMALLSGIVEHQTIGSILSRTDASRVPTRVDAALFAPLLDECLARLTRSREADGSGPWGRGYAFGAMVPTARALALALNEGLYHVFEVTLALMEGQREGRMVVAFPDRVDSVEPEPKKAREPLPPEESLRAGVMAAHATLDAVLARVKMPLAQFQGLSVGETIPLPPGVLKDARLEIGAEAGGLPVTLGKFNGFRAVRLNVGQERVRDLDTAQPSMRDALAEMPEMPETEAAPVPLEALDIATADIAADFEESDALSLEDGFEDLDDLLGVADGMSGEEDGEQTESLSA